jgi:hypothetical protein
MERLLTLLRQPAVAISATVIGLLVLLTIRPGADPDLFARTAVGRLVELNGGVVHQDPFAYTPRLEQWVDHEWLSGVVFYQVARVGGDVGLLLLDLTLMLATVVLVAMAQRETMGGRSWSPLWLFCTMVPAFGIWISVVRSRTFTFLFLALLLLALVRWREKRAGWFFWLIPVLFIPWANMHGGFVVGLGLLGTTAAAVTVASPQRAPALWLCLALSVLVTLLTPYGFKYWDYILGAVTMDRSLVTEWGRLQVFSLLGVHAVLWLAIFVAGAFLSEHRPPPEAWAMVGVAFIMVLSSQRIRNFLLVLLAVYGAGSAKALAAAVASRLESRIPSYWMAARHVAGVTMVLGLGMAAGQTFLNMSAFARGGLEYERYPTDAVDWLATRGEGGRLLVHFNHGSFALWRLHPEYLVSLDGRYEETYPQSTIDVVHQALDPAHAKHQESLQAVSPDYILMEGPDRADGFGAEWNVVFNDTRFAILSHDTLTHNRRPRATRPMWVPGF